MIEDVRAWRENPRRGRGAAVARAELERVATSTSAADNIMIPTIALARAGGTTGEWATTLRAVFGEYRAPTGVRTATGRRGESYATPRRALARPSPTGMVAHPSCSSPNPDSTVTPTARSRSRWPRATRVSRSLTRASHSSPDEIVAAARDEDVDVVGLLDPVRFTPLVGARASWTACAPPASTRR